MRIIHVIDSLNEEAGGPAQACIEMATALARKGHRVSIYAFGDSRPAWFASSAPLPETVCHHRVEVHLFPGGVRGCFGPAGLLAALARAVPEADIVHAHVLYGLHLWAAWRICRRHGTTLIVRPCGILNSYVCSTRRAWARLTELAFQNRLLREAALIHYTTEQEAADAKPYVGNPRQAVVALGIDLRAYDGLPSRVEFDRQYPETSGRKIVLYFGRLHQKKRLDLLIAACAVGVREGHNLHLLIAGPDDGVGAECRRLVEAEGMSGRTTFTGLLVQEAKRIAFGGADLFVLPSMTENFGLAVAEAAASLVPLLISDRVNIAPVFAQAEAAIVVAPELEALTAGLRSLLHDPGAALAMAMRARHVLEQRFTWDVVAEDLVCMYREAARSNSLAPAPDARPDAAMHAPCGDRSRLPSSGGLVLKFGSSTGLGGDCRYRVSHQRVNRT